GRSPGPYSKALLHGAYLRLVTGHGADEIAYERGRALQGPDTSWEDSSPVVGMWPLLKDEFSLARSLVEKALAWGRAVGDGTDVEGTLARLAEIECWTGNWSAADRLAAEAIELTERISSPAFLGSALYARGLVDAHLGRAEQARAVGEQIVELFPKGEGQAAL